MKLEAAKRSASYMKICLSGTSGSGKTYSSLLLARGLTDAWSKICVIDTEQRSASLYTQLGDFNVINLEPPFHPSRYIEALAVALAGKMEVIIIDSISHEWSGKGGCLELHEQTIQRMKVPNSFSAWSTITPLHQGFLDAITQCNAHVICTARSKTEYVLVERNGKQTPQKVGMAPITRDGFEFEMSIHFEVDQAHQVFCSKDRTGLFVDGNPFRITEETGKLIYNWCNQLTAEDIASSVNKCKNLRELTDLYKTLSSVQQEKNVLHFRLRKAEILHQNNTAGGLMPGVHSISSQMITR